MKKNFTLLAAALISVFTASAGKLAIETSIMDDAGTYRYTVFNSAATITRNSDDVLTVPNFLSSGYDLSFKINEPTGYGEDNKVYYVTFVSKGLTQDEETTIGGQSVTETFFYPENADGSSIEGSIVYNRKTYRICDMSFTEDECEIMKSSTGAWKTSWGQRNANGEYKVVLRGQGYQDETKSEDVFFWMDVDLMFDMPEVTEAAVNEISIDNNAPVEFFNLNGIRVDNPENGIFIRKQGGDVKKVIL